MNALMKRNALLSENRQYRYSLVRSWDDCKPRCAFIMLNPSTADENVDDPTIKKCTKFCMTWGIGTLEVVNLFAFRSTDPDDMLQARDPSGPSNDQSILAAAECASIIVAAWGTNGAFKKRDEHVLNLLRLKTICCLDMTKHGFPKHPLYCRDSSTLRGYRKNEIYVLDDSPMAL